MAKSPSTKIFSSSDVGAPVLTNQPGSLIALLDACLVTGYNIKSPTGAVAAAGTVTINYTANHGYKANRVLAVSGASVAALNGQHRIVSAAGASLTVEVTGIADGAIGGAIETRQAPLGWVKQFSATNVAVYKRTDPMATAHVLRVDDTGVTATAGAGNGQNAGVRAFLSMTSTTDGQGEWFTAGSTGYWGKTSASVAPKWRLFGDSRMFYFMPSQLSNFPVGYDAPYAFGDLIPYRSGDAYACTLNYGHLSDSVATGYPDSSNFTASTGRVLAASIVGVGGSVPMIMLGAPNVSGNAGNYQFPDIMGAVHLWPVDSLEVNTNDATRSFYRGRMPGVLVSNQKLLTTFSDLSVLKNVPAIGGGTRDVMFAHSSGAGSAPVGMYAFDISNPWFA